MGYNPKDVDLNGDAIFYNGEDPRRADHLGWNLGLGCGPVKSGWRYTISRWFSVSLKLRKEAERGWS